MSIVNTLSLECNRQIKVNFAGGDLSLLLRGDSGFAKPEFYDQCETNSVSYLIRLKENGKLRLLASDIDERLTAATGNDVVFYAVCYGEFMYQTGSWKYPVVLYEK